MASWKFWLFASAFGLLEGMSTDAEDDRSSSEEGEHNVENSMPCSFAHHVRRPLLQGFATRRRAV